MVTWPHYTGFQVRLTRHIFTGAFVCVPVSGRARGVNTSTTPLKPAAISACQRVQGDLGEEMAV